MLVYRNCLSQIIAAPLFCAVVLSISGGGSPIVAGPQDGLPALEEEWDRSTPRRSLQLFLDSCRENRYDEAAYLLDLSHLAPGKQLKEGQRLARRLKFVLDQTVWFDLELISDDPAGDPADGAIREQIAEVPLGRGTVPILMTRRIDARAGGQAIWLISSQSAQRVPDLYQQYGAAWIAEWLPPAFADVRIGEWMLWQICGLLIILGLAFVCAFLISYPALWIFAIVARRTEYTWDDILYRSSRWPVRWFLVLLITSVAAKYLKLSVPAGDFLRGMVGSGLIFVMAFLISRYISVLSTTLIKRLEQSAREAMEAIGDAKGPADIERGLKARGARTQIIVMRRVAQIIVFIIAAALILTQFEILRQIGTSLLASAGVAGVVIGLAAQKTISNVLAGIQLALTQPVRIGDTVILEGEWGQIEEINLTYVVLKIWDLRRLIVPVSRVLEAPFQNWTKTSPDLLGTIYFYTDYTVPVDDLRAELSRFVKDREDWDGKVNSVLVTKATEQTLEVRALISAKDASDQWSLRCAVREHMVAYLQNLEGGRYLPKTRLDLKKEAPLPG